MAAATPFVETASEPVKISEGFSLHTGSSTVAHQFSDTALSAKMAPPIVPPSHRAAGRSICAPNESRKAASWNDTGGPGRSHSSRSPSEAAAQSLPFPARSDDGSDDVTSREEYALSFPLQALPDELLAHCLARVSESHAGPGCILLRGVCRRWRRIVKSPAFLDLRFSIGKTQEWLVTLTCRTAGGLLCKLFDPLTNKCQVWCPSTSRNHDLPTSSSLCEHRMCTSMEVLGLMLHWVLLHGVSFSPPSSYGRYSVIRGPPSLQGGAQKGMQDGR